MALQLNLVGDPEADALLAEDPLALLIGMLLDQQVPMENGLPRSEEAGGSAQRYRRQAYRRHGHRRVHRRLRRASGCAPIPKSMGERIQLMCQFIVENYDGDTAAIWTSGNPDGKEVLKRLKSPTRLRGSESPDLPGVARKTDRVEPKGWRQAAGDYGLEGSRRSIADVVDEQSLLEVREFKKAAKAAAKADKK